MPEILSRRDALALRRTRYYTGKPCKHKHDCERYTLNGSCVQCINPKFPTVDLPPALDSFKLANGRVVERISKEAAHLRGWRYFFTGQPCDEGHMAERDVKSGRCLECMHPPKYGVDAFTGWWPFQPKPPLRVPPKTTLAIWSELARRIQASIPELVKQIEAEAGIVVERQETVMAHGIMHVTEPRLKRGQYKLWYPFFAEGRGFARPNWMDPQAHPATVPWIEYEGRWFAAMPDETFVPVMLESKNVSR